MGLKHSFFTLSIEVSVLTGSNFVGSLWTDRCERTVNISKPVIPSRSNISSRDADSALASRAKKNYIYNFGIQVDWLFKNPNGVCCDVQRKRPSAVVTCFRSCSRNMTYPQSLMMESSASMKWLNGSDLDALLHRPKNSEHGIVAAT